MEPSQAQNNQNVEELQNDFKQLQLTLPKEKWMGIFSICFYQRFWCPFPLLENTISFQTHFRAFDSDIILASLPKTGTTWLKSLIFAIINRENYPINSQHPLCVKNSHDLIPNLEVNIYDKINGNQPNMSNLPTPRVFSTHIPYASLPQSIKTSKCRIVYVCRNPLDTFVSLWHFHHLGKQNIDDKLEVTIMEDDFDKFCQGKFLYGPYEDHVLGYWKESTRNVSEKVLFMEYEGLMINPKTHLKKLAEFVGYPFSEEEVEGNVVDEILTLCSFSRMKEMDVNKSGKLYGMFDTRTFYRKGEVGDWTNYLSSNKVKEYYQGFQEKVKGFGFAFTYYRPFS